MQLCAFGCLLAFSPADATPVDFTPHLHVGNVDGGVPIFEFTQGNQVILYRPPLGWGCVRSGVGAEVQPKQEGTSVQAEISHQDSVRATNWDDEGLKILRERAKALIPAIAKDVKLDGELRNPLRINGHETIEYAFSGMMLAKAYRFYVLLLPYDGEQFTFTLFADAKEFDKAFQTFDASLYSLSWEARREVSK